MGKKIGFIGAGNMATAIIKGISGKGYYISAFDLDKSKLDALVEFGVKSAQSANEIAQDSDYVFLAVKPQNFETVLDQIKDSVNKNAVVVSIAAGISDSYIKSMLGYDAKVVLVMPNTPLLLGVGATAMAQIEPVTDAEFSDVYKIFESSGVVCKVPQDKMKEIICVNGSTPAFIYLYAKGYIDYAKEQGIDQTDALKLFCATLKGSADMMTDSGFSIDELIKMVSSPGGTTLEGLKVLNDNDLLGTIQKACEATTKRAYELAK